MRSRKMVAKTVAFVAITVCTFGAITFQSQSAYATTPRLGNVAITNVGLDQKTVTLTPPSSTSPGAWVITLQDPTIASVSGFTLTLLKAGATEIIYTQLASGAYTSITRQAVLRVNPGTPVVAAWPALTTALTNKTFAITAPTSSSTGSWIYILTNNVVGGHQIASISGSTITLLDAGTVTINATQVATSNWTSVAVTNTLTITAIHPIIGTFTNVTIAKDSVSSFGLVYPSSSSPGAWSFTSSNLAVASVAGITVTPKGLGTTTITAYQAPINGFSSATATMVLSVIAAPPTVSTTLAPITYSLGSNPGNILIITSPASNSPGNWTYTVADPTIASASGNILTILSPGSTTVTGVQQASGSYGASDPQSFTLNVTATPTFSTLNNLNQIVGDPPRTITPPTSPSNGSWSMTSSNPAVVSTNGLSLVFGDAGTATITLTQAAAGVYVSASTSFTVNVQGLIPTIGTLIPISINVGNQPLTIPNPTSNSLGQWSYMVADPTIANMVDGKLVGIKAGKTTISGNQQPAGKFGQSNTVQTTVTVTPAPPVVVVTPTPTPTPKPTPTTTPKPAPKPTVKPAPKPTVKPAVVPKITVTVSKRVIKIVAKGGTVTATINGKVAKIGNNSVRPGPNLVFIRFKNKEIYSRIFTVK